MRFLLFGYGSIGKRHAGILRDMGHEVASVDPDPRAEAEHLVLESFPLDGQIAFEGVLDCTPPDVRAGVDCVLIWQYGMAPDGLFVEKPLGDVLGATPLLHPTMPLAMMGFCYRWLPSLETFVESLASHRIYSLALVAGAYLPDWHPGVDYRTRYHGTPGRGGVVLDSLSHSAFIARWILGELEVVGRVTGRFSGLDIRTEDTAAVLLRARDTGQPCFILVDYLRKPCASTIEAVTSDGVKRWEFNPDEAGVMYQRQMEAFREVCAGERQYGYPTLADGIAVQQILDAVREGDERGGPRCSWTRRFCQKDLTRPQDVRNGV